MNNCDLGEIQLKTKGNKMQLIMFRFPVDGRGFTRCEERDSTEQRNNGAEQL